MSKRRQKLAKNVANLFILGLSLTILIGFVFQPAMAKGRQAKTQQVATSIAWQSASFPVENFQAYTSGFGYRPSATGGNGWEFHSGLDIAAPRGSYIRNWWEGVVTKVADGGACGTQVTIQSGQWQHTYCHMEGNMATANGIRYLIDRGGAIQLVEGQKIPAGVRIGRVGMSGRTTGPHLHWGLKYNGNHVDPAYVLRAMFAQQPAVRQSSSQIKRQQTQIKIEESKFIRDSGY
ncbi:M23 family metallopeptidase [Calothrix sp. UHCC 0171]|uniref:M23 family metallopeptidase n=1 Tax=Calothrix sp. UHCC 0171 TaxID=3110245 RepID=UPI002B1EBE66|nr:M23 family metallopeptidase [Calothrix sp. UHCC 0171]MEA5569929.1 M23 family metallopeptidase [Calothrix sp. UHCC 0171]